MEKHEQKMNKGNNTTNKGYYFGMPLNGADIVFTSLIKKRDLRRVLSI